MITFIVETLRHRPLGTLGKGVWGVCVGMVLGAMVANPSPSLQVVWACPLLS